MNRPLITIAATALVGLAGLGFRGFALPDPPAQQTALAATSRPFVSFSGAKSEVTERRFVRVSDAKVWTELWKEHRGDAIETNATGWPVVPDINFDVCMVLAMFNGESWNCNGTYVVSMDESADEILMRVDRSTFQTAGPDGGGIRATPYGMFIVPRSDKPIIVEMNVQGIIGQPPKWKEIHRFE